MAVLEGMVEELFLEKILAKLTGQELMQLDGLLKI